MRGCVRRNLGLSSSFMKREEEGALFSGKQGIVSILGTDSECSGSAGKSLRRTLSADMLSKYWILANGVSSPMEKIPSLAEFSNPEINLESEAGKGGGEEDADESRSRFDMWNSIQEQKKNKKKEEETDEKDGNFHTWSSILSEKPREDPKTLPPPYVHPLMKRRSSSLSKKSLENCTESLGSETGSDGFSSSETADFDDDRRENVKEKNQDQKEETEIPEEKVMRHEESIKLAKYNYLGSKKLSKRSFPPPIPSLSRQKGVSTHIITRRDNGRLVLEAFSVVSENNFYARRQDGRLVLTLANASNSDGDKEEETVNQETKKIFKEEDEETQESKEKKKMEFVMEQKVSKFTSGLISFHRLAVMVNKTKMLAYKNPSWPKKFDEIVKLKGKNFEEEEEEEKQSNSRSVASFNGYEYYWGAGATSKDYMFNKNRVLVTTTRVGEENQNKIVVLTRKGRNEMVPLMLKGCYEQKGSLWIWEPYSIATSSTT